MQRLDDAGPFESSPVIAAAGAQLHLICEPHLQPLPSTFHQGAGVLLDGRLHGRGKPWGEVGAHTNGRQLQPYSQVGSITTKSPERFQSCFRNDEAHLLGHVLLSQEVGHLGQVLGGEVHLVDGWGGGEGVEVGMRA